VDGRNNIRTTTQNAGFLIPPTTRGLKIGFTLGKSYLVYGPKLGQSFAHVYVLEICRIGIAEWGLGLIGGLSGYRGSVFNLVYKSEDRVFFFS